MVQPHCSFKGLLAKPRQGPVHDDDVHMTDMENKAAPTGAFGEGAPDQPPTGAPLEYRKNTEQHFSRWAPASVERATEEGLPNTRRSSTVPRPHRAPTTRRAGEPAMCVVFRSNYNRHVWVATLPRDSGCDGEGGGWVVRGGQAGTATVMTLDRHVRPSQPSQLITTSRPGTS